MSIIDRPRRAVQPSRSRRPRRGAPLPDATTSLSLWIGCVRGRTHYRLTPIAPECPEIAVAWTLTKPDGTAYTVHAGHHGFAYCECGDWVYRKADTNGECKHIAALRANGLIPAVGADPDRCTLDHNEPFEPTAEDLEDYRAYLAGRDDLAVQAIDANTAWANRDAVRSRAGYNPEADAILIDRLGRCEYPV